MDKARTERREWQKIEMNVKERRRRLGKLRTNDEREKDLKMN